MNAKEQSTADKLLDEIKTAKPLEAMQLAAAYSALAQGALNRANAENAARQK